MPGGAEPGAEPGSTPREAGAGMMELGIGRKVHLVKYSLSAVTLDFLVVFSPCEGGQET